MSEKIYGDRDLMAMDIAGNHYCRHVDHMTRESLHSKSDIAAELGWRDMQIAELQQSLDAANAERERFAVQCAAAKIAVQAAKAAGFECTLNTPAVDAYLNAVRAEAIEQAPEKAPWLYGDQMGRSVEAIPKEQLIRWAAQLRAETDTTPSQYESLAGGK
ncbi:hypothetical protein [Pantoea sp. 3_1284]|uniref:hypothetical protein n=1 Tax=Pantoea sp. 3_1284 TaxID=2259618 RepID=UPI000DE365CA|nr:hypothetical protein [Pantoea sp. 3_1284]RBO13347.1 hypothetical protein DSL62_09020 [Pantoea sp. 3_1284]